MQNHQTYGIRRNMREKVPKTKEIMEFQGAEITDSAVLRHRTDRDVFRDVSGKIVHFDGAFSRIRPDSERRRRARAGRIDGMHGARGREQAKNRPAGPGKTRSGVEKPLICGTRIPGCRCSPRRPQRRPDPPDGQKRRPPGDSGRSTSSTRNPKN